MRLKLMIRNGYWIFYFTLLIFNMLVFISFSNNEYYVKLLIPIWILSFLVSFFTYFFNLFKLTRILEKENPQLLNKYEGSTKMVSPFIGFHESNNDLISINTRHTMFSLKNSLINLPISFFIIVLSLILRSY